MLAKLKVPVTMATVEGVMVDAGPDLY